MIGIDKFAFTVALASTWGCTGAIEAPGGLAGTEDANPGASNTTGLSATGTGGTGGTGGTADGNTAAAQTSTTSVGSEQTSDNEMPLPDADGNLPYAAPEAVPPTLQARTWKLTHEQYQRSVEDLLAIEVPLVDAAGASLLEPEIDSGVFRNMALSGFVSTALAEDYYTIAEDVTRRMSDAEVIQLIPCGQATVACRDEFLNDSIRRAFRRPATAEDSAGFGALFDLTQASPLATTDATAPFRAVLRGLLTSPYFLYRTEIGTDPGQQEFSLTDHEVASFLAYSVLDQPPSSELLAAAEAGTLGDPTMLRANIESLLSTPAASEQLAEFLQEWLEVVEFSDPEAVRKDNPEFESVRAAMRDETVQFLAEHGGMQGSLADLLVSPVPARSAPLASYYSSEPTGALADTTRLGVLALGTVLATNAKEGATSPTLRGLFVRARLLCQDFVVPEFVPDIGEVATREQPQTTRELYELHASIPTCASCHELIDGVGLTFENFDETGRFRSAQNDVPIDSSGMLLNTDVNTPLRGHGDLAQALAESEWARECLARQAFRFYFGLATSGERGANGTRKRENRGLPAIQDGRIALSQSGNIGQMLAAILSTPSTLARTRFEPPLLSP